MHSNNTFALRSIAVCAVSSGHHVNMPHGIVLPVIKNSKIERAVFVAYFGKMRIIAGTPRRDTNCMLAFATTNARNRRFAL